MEEQEAPDSFKFNGEKKEGRGREKKKQRQ
jgi:hypothetical protein